MSILSTPKLSNRMLTVRERAIYAALSIVTRQNLMGSIQSVRARAYWSESQLQTFQLERLKTVLIHAGKHVPYYRDAFKDAGFCPHEAMSTDDLPHVPILTRDILRYEFERIRDPNAPLSDLTPISTGGTTGQPVKILLDRHNDIERMLVNHRMYSLMGRTLGEPTLLIAGSPIDYQTWTSYRDRLKHILFNDVIRPSFNLNRETIPAILGELSSGKYRYVIAYASVFDILATYAEQMNQRVSLPAIIPCAELVTDAQRSRWQETLRVQSIFEIYGSREMTSIAGELPDHVGLAVNEDIYCVEITDSAGRRVPPGQPGLITITSLMERRFPLIRYQLGDVGIKLPRALESPFPFARLKVTHGRVLDLILCPNGKLLPGEFFPHLFKEVSTQVARFQVVQTQPLELVVKLTAQPGYSEKTTAYLRQKISNQVGHQMTVRFDFVDTIETSASGKFRPTINRIPNLADLVKWN